ncbi:MAG: hypothetical protein IJD93_01970 [Ruminococcus sp.]|nr:hypothetical protein [Ruminococcus sp.]
MKDNLYTQTIKHIKAPANLIEETVKAMQSVNTESEVISMRNKRTFKFASVIAAALALIITFGAVSLSIGDNSEHNFILTVGAAQATDDEATVDEITKEAYINVGELKGFSDAGTSLHKKQYDENGNVYYNMYEGELISLSEEFTVDMTCTGENIESVTYTAHNGFLTYDENYVGLKNAIKVTENGVEKIGGTNGYKWAYSCTFDYNNQPKSSWDKSTVVFEDEDVVDGTIPLRMAFELEFEAGEYYVKIDKSTGAWDVDDIFEKEFNAKADDYALDVTANFKDGTTATKTLKFKCVNEDNQLYMYAIES